MVNPASCRVSRLVLVVVWGSVVLVARTYGSELTSVTDLRVEKRHFVVGYGLLVFLSDMLTLRAGPSGWAGCRRPSVAAPELHG